MLTRLVIVDKTLFMTYDQTLSGVSTQAHVHRPSERGLMPLYFISRGIYNTLWRSCSLWSRGRHDVEPACRQLIELIDGCNHVECHCGVKVSAVIRLITS